VWGLNFKSVKIRFLGEINNADDARKQLIASMCRSSYLRISFLKFLKAYRHLRLNSLFKKILSKNFPPPLKEVPQISASHLSINL